MAEGHRVFAASQGLRTRLQRAGAGWGSIRMCWGKRPHSSTALIQHWTSVALKTLRRGGASMDCFTGGETEAVRKACPQVWGQPRSPSTCPCSGWPCSPAAGAVLTVPVQRATWPVPVRKQNRPSPGRWGATVPLTEPRRAQTPAQSSVHGVYYLSPDIPASRGLQRDAAGVQRGQGGRACTRDRAYTAAWTLL